MKLEDAIKEFLILVKELEQEPNLTAEIVLTRFLKHYRETRIFGTQLEYDDDMLLPQWGIFNPFSANTPVDHRNKNLKVQYEEREQKYLDFSRQIYQSSSGTAGDFDDDAIQMSKSLLYGEANRDEKSSNLWISHPKHIELELEKYYENDFVKQHFNMPVIRLSASVFHCG